MLAVSITIGLTVLGLATAVVMGWRRATRAPMPIEAEISGPSCYPRVDRGGHRR